MEGGGKRGGSPQGKSPVAGTPFKNGLGKLFSHLLNFPNHPLLLLLYICIFFLPFITCTIIIIMLFFSYRFGFVYKRCARNWEGGRGRRRIVFFFSITGDVCVRKVYFVHTYLEQYQFRAGLLSALIQPATFHFLKRKVTLLSFFFFL